MCSITHKAEQVGGAKAERFTTCERVEDQGHKQGTERNECQRVGEVAMELQGQKRISGGMDEHVGVRRQASHQTHESGAAYPGPIAHGLRRRDSEDALGNRVHAASGFLFGAPDVRRVGSADVPKPLKGIQFVGRVTEQVAVYFAIVLA